MKAKHVVTGATVSGDEATLRRLPREWQIEEQEPAKKSAAKKAAAPKKSDN